MKTTNIKTFAVLSLMLFISSIAFSNTDIPAKKPKWFQFVSEEEKVKIKFPSGPTVVDEQLDGGQHHIRAKYESSNGTMFMLDVVHHIDDLSVEENLDQVSLDSFLESIGAEVTTQEDFYVKKHKGIKAIINLENKGVTIDYRVLIVDQQQIQVVLMMPDDEWDQDTVDNFFKSFKLLK